MNVLKDRLIVYDGDCALCSGLKVRAVRYGVIDESDCAAYHTLPAQYSEAIDPNHFRNEMALVEKNGEPTLYGVDGLTYVFSTRYPALRPMFTNSFVQIIFKAVYSVVAPNRYVISTPPARVMSCACAPEVSLAVRLCYILPAHLCAIIATILFGLAVRPLVPEVSSGAAVAGILLITGTGWALHTLFAAVFLPRSFIEYQSHLASVMWHGVLPLFPVILLAAWHIYSVLLVAVCVTASSVWMIFQHQRRARALCLSQWWTVLWYMFLVSGAAFWFFIFWENI